MSLFEKWSQGRGVISLENSPLSSDTVVKMGEQLLAELETAKHRLTPFTRLSIHTVVTHKSEQTNKLQLGIGMTINKEDTIAMAAINIGADNTPMIAYQTARRNYPTNTFGTVVRARQLIRSIK